MKKKASQKPTYRVGFRRRREGLTNYRYRYRLIKSGLPRAVVRKSLRSTVVQIIEFDPKGDRILASANALELIKFGWQGACSNTGAAYFAGYLAGGRAKSKNIGTAVLDIGLQSPAKGSKVFASLKGLVDAGMEIPHDPGILPQDPRLRGKNQDFDAFRKKLADMKFTAPKSALKDKK
jgi:large subunit ribosomal protein L18